MAAHDRNRIGLGVGAGRAGCENGNTIRNRRRTCPAAVRVESRMLNVAASQIEFLSFMTVLLPNSDLYAKRDRRGFCSEGYRHIKTGSNRRIPGEQVQRLSWGAPRRSWRQVENSWLAGRFWAGISKYRASVRAPGRSRPPFTMQISPIAANPRRFYGLR